MCGAFHLFEDPERAGMKGPRGGGGQRGDGRCEVALASLT